MAEYCFIVNPVAGAGNALRVFAEAEELLKARHVDYVSLRSEHPGHATELAAEAREAGHGCIVAVGGDGTTFEVGRALLNSGTPMGILPAGTGNDFCRCLGVPLNDTPAAVEILLNSAPRAVDGAVAGGVPFCNVAGLGWDVDVLIHTERYKQKHSGMTAYLMGIARALLGMKLRPLTIITEEKTITAKALIVAAGNGTHYGGGMPVTPEADPADGLLDVCLVHNVNRLNVPFLLLKFLKGKHIGLTKYVEYWRTKKVTIEAEEPVPLQRDGEVNGETPVTIEVVPGALLVKC